MRLAHARNVIELRRDLNAFISLTDEFGTGAVVAVKDNIDVAGTVTTAGAAPGLINELPAARDAPSIAELRRHAGVVVGKTNMHELALGVTSENPHWGAVRNPCDPDRVAGGSSGGSAAAVVAGMCDWAVGTDTGGSIRIPAAFCGCVGFKPTPGVVSTEGVYPLSRTLDVVGPLAADVRAAVRALSMLSGRPLPMQPVPEPRFAVPAGWFDELDAPTRLAWEAVSAGLPQIQLPHWKEMAWTGFVITFVEALALQRERLEEAPERFGADIRASFKLAAQLSDKDYETERARCQQWTKAVDRALEGYDALLLPTCSMVAPRRGELTPEKSAVLVRFTVPFNVSGHPAISLPAPVGFGRLPVGIQAVGRRGGDAQLADVAATLEVRWSGPQGGAGAAGTTRRLGRSQATGTSRELK